MAVKRFAVLSIEQILTATGYKLIVTTDAPSHLWMRWTTIDPRFHKLPITKRGVVIYCDVRFCFVVYEDNEQEEDGDTILHTFIKEPWAVCETRWFMFWGTIDGVESPSTSGLFSKHRPAPTIPSLFEYYDTGQDTWTFVAGPQWRAQTFIPLAAHSITRVELVLSYYGVPGDLVIEIRTTDEIGRPTGPILTSGEIDGSSCALYPAFGWSTIDLTPHDLVAGTKYAIVAHLKNGFPGTDFMLWWVDASSPTYPRGRFWNSGDWGSVWSPMTSIDFMFREYGFPL